MRAADLAVVFEREPTSGLAGYRIRSPINARSLILRRGRGRGRRAAASRLVRRHPKRTTAPRSRGRGCSTSGSCAASWRTFPRVTPRGRPSSHRQDASARTSRSHPKLSPFPRHPGESMHVIRFLALSLSRDTHIRPSCTAVSQPLRDLLFLARFSRVCSSTPSSLSCSSSSSSSSSSSHLPRFLFRVRRRFGDGARPRAGTPGITSRGGSTNEPNNQR